VTVAISSISRKTMHRRKGHIYCAEADCDSKGAFWFSRHGKSRSYCGKCIVQFESQVTKPLKRRTLGKKVVYPKAKGVRFDQGPKREVDPAIRDRLRAAAAGAMRI